MKKISRDEVISILSSTIDQIEVLSRNAYDILERYQRQLEIKDWDKWYKEYYTPALYGYHEENLSDFPGLCDIKEMLENEII